MQEVETPATGIGLFSDYLLFEHFKVPRSAGGGDVAPGVPFRAPRARCGGHYLALRLRMNPLRLKKSWNTNRICFIKRYRKNPKS